MTVIHISALRRVFSILKASVNEQIALSSITFKPAWWHNTTSDKRSQLLTVYWNVNVLYELEVEQNCASLGCVYPAHGSASNMTV